MKKLTRHRTAWSLFLVLSPCLLATSSLGQDEIQTIRLSRTAAMAWAIRNNVDLRVRAIDSSLAENSIQASRSIYNPTVNASLDYGRTNVAGETYGSETTRGYLAVAQNLPTGGNVQLFSQTGPTSSVADPLFDYTDWSSSVGLTVYQPLLKNAGIAATELGISLDTYTYTASLDAFRNNVIETVFAVISDYNRLYVLRQLLQSREAAVLSAQQLLEEIKTTPGPGDNPQIELANTEYALSQRQTELIEVERQVSSKEASLRYLIGLPGKTHILPLDPPSTEEPAETETQAINLALEQRPDLRELRTLLEASALRQRVAQGNLWPDLSLSASGGFRGYAPDGGFSDTADQIGDSKGAYWSAGMRLTIPLGNDLAQSEHRRHSLRTEQLKNQIKAAEWKARDLILDDNRSLISARLQLRSTTKSRSLAEQRVAQYQKNRRLGSASVKDLLDAENDLIAARTLELNAVENFSFLVARLWKDCGVLLERQNIQIDTRQPELLATGELPPAAPPETVPAAGPPPAADRGTATPSYTLYLGEFIPSELMAVKMAIARAGLAPVMLDGDKQEREVIRLFSGQYPDLASAQGALKALQVLTDQGFILKNTARGYDVFAGSYFAEAAAQSAQRQLETRGVKVSQRKVTLLLPTVLVTAGSYSSPEAARAGLERLAQQGLSATILQSRE